MNRVVAFLLLALAIGDSFACYYKGSSSEKPVVTEAPEVSQNDIGCGLCGDPIDVTIVFRNIHQEPKFEFEVTVLNKPQRPLQFFLEEAAKQDKRARDISVIQIPVVLVKNKMLASGVGFGNTSTERGMLVSGIAIVFTSSYWSEMGYMIESINKVKANYAQDKTYWRIVEHISENSLQLGASSYIPEDQEILQFNFTATQSHHGR